MAAKTKEGTSPDKRGRTKVGNIPKRAQDMPSKHQKKIKGGYTGGVAVAGGTLAKKITVDPNNPNTIY